MSNKNENDVLFSYKVTAEQMKAEKDAAQKERKPDGILRIKPSDGVDGKRELTIRFLPNITDEKKALAFDFYQKTTHYVKFDPFKGYIDCQNSKNLNSNWPYTKKHSQCILCETNRELRASTIESEAEKASNVSLDNKFYNYVYVVEDKQQPDNEGKIMILAYGKEIQGKIEAVKTRSTKILKPVTTPEDLIEGAEFYFNVTLKDVPDKKNPGKTNKMNDYDECSFGNPEPISFAGVDMEDRKAVWNFYVSKEFKIEDILAKTWDEKTEDKVDKIVSILTSKETAKQRENKSTASTVFDESPEEVKHEDKVASRGASTKEVEAAKKSAKDFWQD